MTLVLAVVTGGCNGQPQGQTEKAVPAPAATTSKPQAPIDIRYSLGQPAQPGQPVDLEIVVAPVRAGKISQFEVNPREGMRIIGRGAFDRDMEGYPAGALKQVVTVVPQLEGVHHVVVKATIVVDGESQGRVFAIPIQAGKSDKRVAGKGEAMGELRQTDEGELIEVLPAQQTVSEDDGD